MAVAFVKDFSNTGLASTIVLTVPAGGIASGNLLVLFIMNDTSGTTVSSISDDSGGTNVYSQISAETSNATTRSFLWYSPIASALSASSSITVTLSAATGGSCVCAEFSGLTSSPFDKEAHQHELSNTVHTSGLTPTTTQADELVVGCYGDWGSTTTVNAGASYTQNETQTPFGVWRQAMQYKVVSVTGTYESDTSTAPTSTTSNSHVATFKADTGTPVGNIAWIVA